MIRTLGVSVLALLVQSLVIGTTCFAIPAQIVIDTNDPDLLGTTAGGEFGVEAVGTRERLFESFCIETNELISNNGVYWTEISDRASFGGSGGPNPDPIAAETAYIFKKWWDNDGFDATGDSLVTDEDANVVQWAIWTIEQESFTGPTSDQLDDVNDLIADAVAHNTGSIGGVRVMQLWTHQTLRDSAHKAQDQLTVVPEMSSVLLWGTIGGVFATGCWFRRRRRIPR